MTPKEIVNLIGNFGNRPDLRKVQDKQIKEITTLLLNERRKTIEEMVQIAHNLYTETMLGHGPMQPGAISVAILMEEKLYECDIPDDVCCCGDAMENHDSAMNCGHSPVSMRDHHRSSK